jgi:hypothetical protein
VEDFLVEHETWRIRYLVVDSHKLLPGKRVLVSPDWVESIQWADRAVNVSLKTEVIRDAPQYTGVADLEDEYEATLRDHFDTGAGDK